MRTSSSTLIKRLPRRPGAERFLVRQWQANVEGKKQTLLTIVCAPVEEAGFFNAFTTRLGGVSPLPKADLNFSDKGDTRANVRENTRRFFEAAGVSPRPLLMAHQIHSDIALWVDRKRAASRRPPSADALMTKTPGLFLAVKSADCLPLLMADPKTGAAAAVHAGWRGTLASIAPKTVAALHKKAGVDPSNLLVALGPAACGRCFEVGPEVASNFKAAFPDTKKFLWRRARAKTYDLDTALANVQQLEAAGVRSENIFVAPFCTMHSEGLFFSHRRESKRGQPAVGRQVAVVGRVV